jgi:predicted unusual protein kinase regulating ubiquinone biosynthesis (AarF/ABC1/UbiB family)
MTDRKRRRSRVPTSRIERFARIGMMAGEFALGGIAESAKRLVGRGAPPPEPGASAIPGATMLTGEVARRLAERLSRLRGAAMKLGQLLSLQGDDLLPPEFAEALSILRASADSMPPAQVRRVLGREYGKGWEERFERFEFEPLAAASIGQVHLAVARDGRMLALKIQYPGVARSIESDVDNLASVLRVARILPVEVDVSGLVAEAKRQLRREADYFEEAANLKRYRALVADEPRVRVPAVHDDLTTRRILAMDYVTGRPIEELRSPDVPQAERDALGTLLHRLVLRELFEFRFMQTDPNFANYLYEPASGQVALLDFGAAGELAGTLVEGYRALFRAAVARDREALHAAALAIGFAREDDRPDRREGLLDLILLVCEPLRHRGVYDFGRSDLAARTRDAGFELAFGRGFLRPPPPETIFLHRKLAGTFFLCARIRARVDAAALLAPYL